MKNKSWLSIEKDIIIKGDKMPCYNHSNYNYILFW